MPGQSVAGTLGQDAHGCTCVDYSLGDFVHCAVPADREDSSEVLFDSLPCQFGGVASFLRKFNSTFQIELAAGCNDPTFHIGPVACTRIFIDYEKYLVIFVHRRPQKCKAKEMTSNLWKSSNPEG